MLACVVGTMVRAELPTSTGALRITLDRGWIGDYAGDDPTSDAANHYNVQEERLWLDYRW